MLPQPKKEAYAIVLDFLPQGRSSEAMREPLAQVVGENFFTLLEIVPKPGTAFAPGERVYVGPDERPAVDHIKGRVTHADLTSTAQRELPDVLRKIVRSREPDFVNFLNRAGPISIRLHSLELLPGVGKKHLEELVAERDKKPFSSFADVHERISTIGHPEEMFVNRILEELRGSKYYLFAKMPSREQEERGSGARFNRPLGDRGYGRRH